MTSRRATFLIKTFITNFLLLSVSLATYAQGFERAVWVEYAELEKLEEQLEVLKRHNIELQLKVDPYKLEPESVESFLTFFQKAQLARVKIKPWLLLNEEDGYWANQWNVDEFSNYVDNFVAQMSVLENQDKWIIIDMRPPIEHVWELSICGMNPLCYRKLAQKNKMDSFIKAHTKYKELVQDLHLQGYKVQLITNSLVLHDFADNSYQIQFLLGSPVQGIDWDLVSFMVHKPEFEKQLGALGSDVVYRYGQLAKMYFGDKAALDLGPIGFVSFPLPTDGYIYPVQLYNDVAAAKAAGINRVHFYSLENLLETEHPLDHWFDPVKAERPKSEKKMSVYFWLINNLKRILPKVVAEEEN